MGMKIVLSYLHCRAFIENWTRQGKEYGACVKPHISGKCLEELRTAYGANFELLRKQLTP